LSRSARDRRLLLGLRGLAAVSGSVVLLIVAFLVAESLPALRSIGIARFFGDASWHPAAEAANGTFGSWPIVVGTLLVSAGAILLATPLGVCSAVWGRFYAPLWLAGWYRGMVDLMAGVPSVVYGLWGLVVLVPLLGRIEPPGQSLLAGVLILTLMILPTIALLTDAALGAVPRESLHGAAALGLTPTAVAFRVAVPAARSGIVTAILLGLVRAIGETMAVLMVTGNVVRLPACPFDPIRTLTATIALEMGYARGDHRAALFACGLVLLLLVIGLIAITEVVDRRRVQ
jgi:phosphate transport system permease protein